MRPVTTCAKCKTELSWGQTPCPSCGTAIEWPGSGKRTTKTSPAAAFPIRNVVVLVVVIAAAVIVLELITAPATRPAPVTAQQAAPAPSADPTGPDMNALPHINELEAQVKAQPANVDLKKELANHLMDARFFDRAIAVYRDVLKTRPKDANVRVDMGICMKETGDLDGAKAEMKKALTDVPEHLQAHYNLGIVCLVQGNLAEANDWFSKTANLAPQSELGQRAKQMLQQHAAVPTP
jgi:Tfp pilus assembly protein PilF